MLPTVFDNFSDRERTKVLMSYVKRARKGSLDSALLVGTSKDLLEAVAKHVVQVKWGHDNYECTFPMLLGQAFSALKMETIINDNEKVTPIHVPFCSLAIVEAMSEIETEVEDPFMEGFDVPFDTLFPHEEEAVQKVIKQQSEFWNF